MRFCFVNIMRATLLILMIIGFCGFVAEPQVLAQALSDDAAEDKPFVGKPSLTPAPIVTDIVVRGNAKVESDAILTILSTAKGSPLKSPTVQDDIRSLFDLGYFSDIRVFTQDTPGGVMLIFQVVEKPAIVGIEIKGNEEVTEESIREKLETKLYTIVNEATVTSDVRMIEKQYLEKGYFLAQVSYTLEEQRANEVNLVFHVDEGGKVQVGEVSIIGNEYFTDNEILNGYPGMISRPITRSSVISSSSIYQADIVKRDVEYLSYIYKDQGFADVKVGKPIQQLDSDRQFVRLTFEVEEGIQYHVGSIDVSGDLLFPKEELIAEMNLKQGALFRHSFLAADVEFLGRKYGDLGYAYADVNPRISFDKEQKLAHINYEITKGEKVYFGKMTIIGNVKTRDNVIRREFEIADSELYHGTGLAQTRDNINRLGYFEEVQVIQERDNDDPSLLRINVKVKEKPTGQLQAALGYTPNSSGSAGSQWFGQGSFDEKNLYGRGWNSRISGKWNGEENYSLETSFSDPRVNDSKWLAGVSLNLSNELREWIDGVKILERRYGGSVFVGRDIIELVKAQITYHIEQISTDTEGQYMLSRFQEDGLASSLIFSLRRLNVNNYIDPSEGTEIVLRQRFTGGKLLGGDQQYMESEVEGTAYIPIDFSETMRTYFKLHGLFGYLYPMGDKPVPFLERYRLGGPFDMRGFKYQAISPLYYTLYSPTEVVRGIPKGGDKKILFQLEYFVPLIPEAGIKAVAFTDIGRVYDDQEAVSFSGFEKDVGFGLRWITPLAPFRFEWAYPIVDGRLGEGEIIFNIGY